MDQVSQSMPSHRIAYRQLVNSIPDGNRPSIPNVRVSEPKEETPLQAGIGAALLFVLILGLCIGLMAVGQ